MDLTIFSLTTLGSMKTDALDIVCDPEAGDVAVRFALDICKAVDAECDRRVRWVDNLVAALNGVQ